MVVVVFGPSLILGRKGPLGRGLIGVRRRGGFRKGCRCNTLKTLTSLNKEVRPFFLSDNSIWSLPSVSFLSDYSIWSSWRLV